jgi:hypothetical protein
LLSTLSATAFAPSWTRSPALPHLVARRSCRACLLAFPEFESSRLRAQAARRPRHNLGVRRVFSTAFFLGFMLAVLAGCSKDDVSLTPAVAPSAPRKDWAKQRAESIDLSQVRRVEFQFGPTETSDRIAPPVSVRKKSQIREIHEAFLNAEELVDSDQAPDAIGELGTYVRFVYKDGSEIGFKIIDNDVLLHYGKSVDAMLRKYRKKLR